MAKQIIFVDPNNDWNQIDNSAAPTFPTLAQNTHLGYDTTWTGASAQGSNPTSDTGSTTLDINGNDTVTPDPQVGTVAGNPVQNTQPTYKTVTKVINNAFNGVCVAWKNPA